MKRAFFASATFSFFAALSGQASAFTLGQYIHTAENWLKCEDVAPAERFVCDIASAKVNEKLNAAGIRLDQGDLLYERHDFAAVNEKRGCKDLRSLSSTLGARVNMHVPMTFSGNLIAAPFVATLTLPAHVDGRIRVRERSRSKILGSCVDPTTSDDWDLVATGDLTAHSRLIVSLEPKYGRLPNGDYEITLDPFVSVDLGLDGVGLDTKIRGRESGWFTVHDAFNTFSGISQGLQFDTPLFLLGALQKDEFLKRWKMETKVNEQIARALGLDEDNKVRFVIPAAAVRVFEQAPAKVSQTYCRVLGRKADAGGHEGWVASLRSGNTVKEAIRGFAHSPEFEARFVAGRSPDDAVRAIYDALLARDVDPTGAAGWGPVVAQQGYRAVVDAVLGSEEYRVRFGEDTVPGDGRAGCP